MHGIQLYVVVMLNTKGSKFPKGQEQSEDSRLVPKHEVQVPSSGVQVWHLGLVHLTQSYVVVVPKVNRSI